MISQVSPPAQVPTFNALQDRRIRVSSEHAVLESEFDEVLGQDATQAQIFTAAQGTAQFGIPEFGRVLPAKVYAAFQLNANMLKWGAGCVDSVLDGYNSSVLA